MIPMALPPLNLSNKSGADGNMGGNQGGASGNFSGTLSINTGQGGKTSATGADGNKSLIWIGAGLAALWIFRH